jgi:hypothetical protein
LCETLYNWGYSSGGARWIRNQKLRAKITRCSGPCLDGSGKEAAWSRTPETALPTRQKRHTLRYRGAAAVLCGSGLMSIRSGPFRDSFGNYGNCGGTGKRQAYGPRARKRGRRLPRAECEEKGVWLSTPRDSIELHAISLCVMAIRVPWRSGGPAQWSMEK